MLFSTLHLMSTLTQIKPLNHLAHFVQTMAKARESAGKGRVVRRMNKEEFVSFDRSIPIRNAIVKEDLEEPKG